MVRPLGDRVLVRKIARDRVRASGIVLPDTMREQSDRGEVQAVGPGFYTSDGTLVPIDTWVEEGMTVLFSPYAGSQVVVDDEEFLLLRIGDVLGVLQADESDEMDAATTESALLGT